MEPIEVGERIRSYREQLGITREQLAAGKISSSLIKYIEQGKRKLTPIRAAIIAANLNEIAMRKELQFKISASDLLMPNYVYAEMICNNRLKEVNNKTSNENDYMSIIQLGLKYNLDSVLLEAYRKLADYYYFNGNYSFSINYLKKSITLSHKLGDYNNSIEILKSLGNNYHMMCNYKSSIAYFNKCYDYLLKFNPLDKVLESKLLYNLSLTYKALNNYDKSLECIEKIFTLASIQKPEIYKSKILQANIYLNLGRYSDALEIYKYVVEQNSEYLYIVQHNMAVAFGKLNKSDACIKYFTESIKSQLALKSPTITLTLMDIGQAYFKEKLFREAIVFYEHAFDNSLELQQLNEFIICTKSLFELYTALGKIKNIENIINRILKVSIINNDNINLSTRIKYLVLEYLLKFNKCSSTNNKGGSL